MPFCLNLRTSIVIATLFASSLLPAVAQQPSANLPAKQQQPKLQPREEKPPALVDPAGPTVSLQTSEALFDVAVALNACGYDNGLAESDPVRARIRDQVNQAMQQSEASRDARDKLCVYISQHRLGDASRDLAQYVSLALYLTPPPELALSVDQDDMPPDSTQVIDMLPLLHAFVDATQLHLIWIANHTAYEDEVAKLHDPLTRMIVTTNVYLKMPASTYSGSRFLVVLEPLLSPAETNARVYGPDYVVVASPVNGAIHMQEARHTYLHYEIEPLLYSRASAMDRLLPILKAVRDAPLDFQYRSDVVSLVIECLIRAIEARTMDTDVAEYKIPDDVRRNDLERETQKHNASLQQIAAVRQKAVNQSMVAGFVLTQYFYDQLIAFERTPDSLKEAIGPMVYGMDIDQQTHRARDIHFAEEGDSDVIRHATRTPHGLDLAEIKLHQGDAAGAEKLAQQALAEHTPDPGRADYILALTSVMQGRMDDAEKSFNETLRLSKDPRILAWSHIYLGRIHDIREERDEALVEYKTALTVRDGQPDTKAAAEKGIKQPFEPPHSARQDQDDNSDDDNTSSAKPQTQQQTTPQTQKQANTPHP
ncbi:tetratricopeptide repeat protein [Alloacidobacterium dinghuense]|uniref:Tetratricopeptide repeat protein n=1 Tax=Alloacidobacterium dinghuense TaxID=2763107 RepID=A0A7G8BJ33_9BACT|nr:tetratricopeptide repeat protein [Alloacidobacterium dinghuense]QNI32553.1 tetratricopeptide repeat protein [Alloacidobacterium dinghuense]